MNRVLSPRFGVGIGVVIPMLTLRLRDRVHAKGTA